jgi:hypothetical protein
VELYAESGYSADEGECAVLTVDVRDAVGDRLHISEEFKKDGVRLSLHSKTL